MYGKITYVWVVSAVTVSICSISTWYLGIVQECVGEQSLAGLGCSMGLGWLTHLDIFKVRLFVRTRSLGCCKSIKMVVLNQSKLEEVGGSVKRLEKTLICIAGHECEAI